MPDRKIRNSGFGVGVLALLNGGIPFSLPPKTDTSKLLVSSGVTAQVVNLDIHDTGQTSSKNVKPSDLQAASRFAKAA